jgi:transposase
VLGSEEGWFAHELKECLHVGVKESLLKLTKNGQISRKQIYGIYLYCSADPVVAKEQVLARKAREEQEQDIEQASDEVKAALVIFWSVLDEKSRRLFAGFESLRVGYGGDKEVAQWLGLDPHTVAKGRRELLERDVELERVRKVGGGRRGKKSPEVIAKIEALMEYETAGDPMTGLLWTRRTRESISRELKKAGIDVSPTTVGEILKDLNYSLKCNAKKVASGGQKRTEEEKKAIDGQFEYIAKMRQQYTARGLPVLCRRK